MERPPSPPPASADATPHGATDGAHGAPASWLVRIGSVAAGLLVLAGVMTLGMRTGGRRGVPAAALQPQGRVLGEFTLTDRTGRTVSRRDLEGRYCVVSFVSTACGFTCTEVSRRLATVQRGLAGRDDVRLVSFTIDPRTDTPQVLSEFARKFGADTNRWFFLTGDREPLFTLIEDSFLPADKTAGLKTVSGGFLHTDHIAVVDPGGRVLAYFDGLKPGTPAAILELLAPPAKQPAP